MIEFLPLMTTVKKKKKKKKEASSINIIKIISLSIILPKASKSLKFIFVSTALDRKVRFVPYCKAVYRF